MEQWKTWLVQGASGTYLATSVWFGHVDYFVKVVLGMTMIVLGWNQVILLRAKQKRQTELAQALRLAKARCIKSATGDCPLQSEIDKLDSEGIKP